MSMEPTPAIERAAMALKFDRFPGQIAKNAREAITAALTGPKDQYDCMDDVTIAVHAAICETSPEDCVAWRGPCVKAVEAARAALLGDAR